MKISKLQYITNGRSAEEILTEIETVVRAGCDWVQLRIKNPKLDFLEIAKKAKEICDGKAILIINDKVDIAYSIDADGVHLGLDDMSIKDARKMLGEDKIIGGTANVYEDCVEREKSGADYIGLGPYRLTQTKSNLSPVLGLEGYKEILPKMKARVGIPIVAIGGIKVEDIAQLKEDTGVFGIAVSSLIGQEENKENLIQKINELLN